MIARKPYRRELTACACTLVALCSCVEFADEPRPDPNSRPPVECNYVVTDRCYETACFGPLYINEPACACASSEEGRFGCCAGFGLQYACVDGVWKPVDSHLACDIGSAPPNSHVYCPFFDESGTVLATPVQRPAQEETE